VLGFKSPNYPPSPETGLLCILRLAIVRTQQKLIQSQRSNSDCYRVFNLLTSDTLLDKVEEQLPDHRERLFPPTETLAMFITQALSADRSCQNIVNQAAIQRLIGRLPSCSTHTGRGYCRARQRLPLPMITELPRHPGRLVDDFTPTNGGGKSVMYD